MFYLEGIFDLNFLNCRFSFWIFSIWSVSLRKVDQRVELVKTYNLITHMASLVVSNFGAWSGRKHTLGVKISGRLYFSVKSNLLNFEWEFETHVQKPEKNRKSLYNRHDPKF